MAVLVAGFAAGEATGWVVLRGTLQRQASQAAGVPIDLGGRSEDLPRQRVDGQAPEPFQLHLLGQPRLQLNLLTVGAAQGVEAPHLLRAEDVVLAWRWMDVWQWWRGAAPLRIANLTAHTLDARLLRLADGRASWALGAAAKPETSETPQGSKPLPQFDWLHVGSGHVQLDDAVLNANLQINVQGGEGDARPSASAGGPVAATTAATAASSLGAREAGPPLAPSGYRADVQGHWQSLPLELAVRVGGPLLALREPTPDEAGSTSAMPLRVEGKVGAAQLLFDGRAAALLGARQLDGEFRFSGPSLAAVGAPLGVTLPRTPAFKLQGRLAHEGQVWRLRADSATIGRSALSGDFRLDSAVRPNRLSGQLKGSRLLLADLGPAIGGPGEGRSEAPGATAPPAPAPGRVLPQRRFDLPSLRAMDADVLMAIDVLDLGSASLAPLQSVRGHVLLQGGVLKLQDLQAGVAGGQIAGNSQLDGRGEPARWDLGLRFNGIDLAGWVRALQSPSTAGPSRSQGKAALEQKREAARRGGDQPVVSYATGVLGGAFQLAGTGNSTAQILSTLQGRIEVQLRDGTLSHLATEAAGLDLAQALGVLVRGDRPLPLRCAVVDLAVDQGVASVRRGVVDNADSTLRVDGRIDLRDEQLALRATAHPKDFSPLALRTPVLVTGSLAQPRLGLDGRGLGKQALAAAALAVIAAPAAALLALVDPGQKEPGDPCASK